MAKHYSNNDVLEISEKMTSHYDKLTKYYLNWTLLITSHIVVYKFPKRLWN